MPREKRVRDKIFHRKEVRQVTVEALIAKLMQYPPETRVMLLTYDGPEVTLGQDIKSVRPAGPNGIVALLDGKEG